MEPFCSLNQRRKRERGFAQSADSDQWRQGYNFSPHGCCGGAPKEFLWLGRFLLSGIIDGEHRSIIESLSGGKMRLQQSDRFNGIVVQLFRSILDRAAKRGALKRTSQSNKERMSLFYSSFNPGRWNISMVSPNTQCIITKIAGTDVRDRPVFGDTRAEPCSIIKLLGNDDTDIAMGIGSAPEYPTFPGRIADAVLLLPITTRADINDMIEVAGVKLKVIGISPRYDVVGKRECYIVEAMLWE